MKRFKKSFSLIGLLILVACATTSVVDKPIEPSTVEIAPTPKEKTPEDIVNDWLSFAREKKWQEMAKIAQMTWVSKKGSKAAEEISWNYDFFDIKSWKIISTSRQRDTFYTITVEVDTQLGKKVMKANVIKEISPYQESVNGKWGINPISAILR
ncbi:MAG: hypothetical protein QQN41_05595 [Nitrosopumilus sp.]